MDLLSRLTSPRANKTRITDPTARFDSTKEACNDILTILAKPQDERQYEALSKSVNTLVSVIKEEQRFSNESDVCSKYFLNQGCLMKLSAQFKELPPWMFNNVNALFRVLFDSDHDTVIKHRELAFATTEYLKAMSSIGIDRRCEEDFSQLMFIIVSKMKAIPDVITHWFEVLKIGETAASFQDEFPLFYLLLDYVYHEGKVGEYARTGLLYLVDMVSVSVSLEKWVLQSDFCTLIVSGLGALYSQLNRGIIKLDNLSIELPAIVSLSNGENNLTSANKRAKQESMEYKSHMENFIAYLHFWQDLVNYCKSDKVRQRLLAHFDLLFVRQLLYPSIVESTDNEGGYSIPLLTVLRKVLQILEQNKLSEIILRYFSGLEMNDAGEQEVSLLSDGHGHVLLTLKDIILTCLEPCRRSDLKLVALQLLEVLIEKFYPYLVDTMFNVSATDAATAKDDIPEFLCVRELSILKSMKADIACGEDLTNISDYESDIEMKIVNYPYLLPSQVEALLPEERVRRGDIDKVTQGMTLHAIRPEDKLMRRLYELLLEFFSNSAQVNLALTGVFIELGNCGWCSLRSWLLVFDPSELVNDTSPTNLDILKNTKVLQVLQDLCNQYQHYTVIVDQFEQGLHEFEKSVKVSEDLNDAIKSDRAVNTVTTPDASDDEHEFNRSSPTPPPAVVTTPVRKVRRELSKLSIPRRRSSPQDVMNISRASSTSTLASSSNLDQKLRVVRPSAETMRSISQKHRIPSELQIDTEHDRPINQDDDDDDGGDEEEEWNKDVRLAGVFGNIIILREFLKEIEALIHIRAWLVD